MRRFKKPSRFNYDLIVIGSGASGGVAAHLAANEGKRVALVESHALGGDSPHFGSIPTKALLKSAKTLRTMQQAPKFGIRSSSISYNYQSIQAWKDAAITATGVQRESSLFKHQGINILRGRGHFLDPWTLSLGLKRITGRKFLIATGSLPYVPDIPELNEAGFITYKQASNLLKTPTSLFIIGGGPVAYEYSQIFSTFGCRVHIAEIRNHLLPFEDTEIGDSVEIALTSKGIKTHIGANIIQIASSAGKKIITFEQNGKQYSVATEKIMVAAGKLPNIDLGLENTGIKLTDFGIRVNRYMQTSCKHIFAAGDVLGIDFSTHAAIQEGQLAIHNMYNRKKIAMDYHAIPRCYFGDPEIAVVGKTEHQLKASAGGIYQTSITPIKILGKAITSNYSLGFVKIIANHNGVLLGASIVAPHASEMIQELTFAIQHRHHACEVAKTIHPFPTWSEAIRIAASKIKCI
jgi:dihydrolipoamide dehydrogenase